MAKFKEHIKRHTQKVVHVSRHVHRHLKAPIHAMVGWWAVSVSLLIALTIVGTGVDALAQTASSTGEMLPPPLTQQLLGQPPVDGQSQPGMQSPSGGNFQPMRPVAPCEPGKPCAPPQNGNPGQPGSQPNGFNDGQMGEPNNGQGQQMDEQRFEMMKRNLKQFTREVVRIKTQIQSLQKKGVNIPVELSGAIAQMDAIAEKIKNAENADAIEDDMNDFQDATNTIREWMPKLGRMAQMPQMFKQAEKEISKAEKAYASDAKRIKSSKIDLNDLLAEFRKAIDEQKGVLDQVKQLSGNDPEKAIDDLQDNFFGNMDNMWEKERVIQMALNIKQGISQMSREMKDADKLIKKLKAKKLDTGELEQLLAQAKAELEQVKVLAAAKPIDPESLMDQIEKMMDIKQEFGDKVQELTGDTGYAMPQQPQGRNFQFNTPSGFMMSNSGPGGQGGGFGQQGQGQSGPTCRINGVEVPGKCEDLQRSSN
ncbi:MAG: hypothetical protein AAB729_00675 [Patescibacteria group bacterium]